MKKIISSIVFFASLNLMSMESDPNQFGHILAHLIFDNMMSHQMQQNVSPTPASTAFNSIHLISLLESQMSGEFNAFTEMGQIKLDFPNVIPGANKARCTLARANEKIAKEVNQFNEQFPGMQARNLIFEIIKANLGTDSREEITTEQKRLAQLARFVCFSIGHDLDVYLEQKKEKLKLLDSDSEETKKVKKTKLEKVKKELDQIKVNRLSLRNAMTAGNEHMINEKAKNKLHVGKFVSLLDHLNALKPEAAKSQTT